MENQTTPQDEVLLPTNEADLDAFVASIIDQFKLPPGDDTYDAIATMIMHLPNTRAYATRAYFGNGVLKSMANKAAYAKLMGFQKKRMEADQAEKELAKATQSDQGPARDEQPV